MEGRYRRGELSLKMVMLGDSGVGKTSLVKCWSSKVFEPDQVPTVGAISSLHQVKLGSDNVDISLWDTAGQEVYDSLTPLFLRQIAVAILTVAMENSDSFRTMNKWTEMISQTCQESPPIVLAVNKTDLKSDLDDESQALLKEYEGMFSMVFYVSAKERRNIEELFHYAAEQGYKFATAHHNRIPYDTGEVISDASRNSGCC